MLHALIENLVQLPFAWDLLLKSTVILMAAWSIHLLLAHSHPRWRVLLWRGVMVSLLLIPITLLMLPRC